MFDIRSVLDGDWKKCVVFLVGRGAGELLYPFARSLHR